MSQTIHYQTNKSHSMPISGIHIECFCGKWFQLNYSPDSKRYTKDINKVTCKRCLKAIEKSFNKGLKRA